MKIDIFDVNHGACALITAPNGRRMMIDCGSKSESDHWWAPSMHFMRQYIDVLAITNLDEDHLRDFEELMKYVSIGMIITNPTIGAPQLLGMKSSGMGSGVRAFAQWLAGVSGATPQPFADFGGVRIWWYHNNYSWFKQLIGSGNKTNDLSLVLFVEYAGFRIAFCGDMERGSWTDLLAQQPQLAKDLQLVNVLIAPHHGRESGCSEDLFAHCRPQLVIVSDGPSQYESQDTNAWYRARCHGANVLNPFTMNPFGSVERRHVCTTRRDGPLQINVATTGWQISPVRVQNWQYRPATPTYDPLREVLGIGALSSPNSYDLSLARILGFT